MTNRQWIGNMALIDFIKRIIEGSDQCFLCMLGALKEPDRCDKYYHYGKKIDDTCYDCVRNWLNEKNI